MSILSSILPEGARPQTVQDVGSPASVFDIMPEDMRSQYSPETLDAARQSAQHGDHYSESPSEFAMRRSFPFLSAGLNLVESQVYSRAKERIRNGTATQQDRDLVQTYEARQRHDQNQGFGMQAAGALASVPAIAGEAFVAGQVGAGLGITARAPSIAAAITSPASWGRNAFMTAAMPSMWMPQWSEGNIRAGRDAMDPRGLPSAYAMGFLNTAVLGSLGPVGEVSGQSVFNTARNVLAATGRGMLEQQGVDIMASAVSEALPEGYKLETGYGLLGAAVRSPNQFWRQAATQAITFAAFSIMHQRPGELEPFTDLTRDRARSGVSASEAAKEVLAIQADPAKFTDSKDTKVRNYAEALQMPAQGPQPGLEAMPEGRAPSAPMPGKMLPPRPERPGRESVRPAPEPPTIAPETRTPEQASTDAQERPSVQGAIPERPAPVLQGEPRTEAVPSASSVAKPEAKKELASLIRKQKSDIEAQNMGLTNLPKEGKVRRGSAVDLPPEHQESLKNADLPLNERRALEAILSGLSYREAGKKFVVSQERVHQRVEKALERLRNQDPAVWGDAQTVEDVAADIRYARGELLREKGKLVGQAELSNVGEKARQAEGMERDRVAAEIDRDIDARQEQIDLYKKEIEASREELRKEGERQGRSRAEVERAAEESYQQALAAETTRRQAAEKQAARERPPATEPVPAAEQRLAPPAEPVLGGGQADLAKPYQRETALANAVTEKERELRQETPLEAAARQDNPTTWQMAKDAIARDPAIADRLVAEVLEKPRPLKTEEQAVLLHEKINLSNRYDALVKEYMATKDPERAIALETDERLLMAKRDQLDQAIHKTGTELGRSLAFRRQLAASDYTLQGLLFRAQKAKGKELTPEERTEITDLQKKIEELTAKIAELEKAGKDTVPAEVELKETKRTYQKKFVDQPEYAKKTFIAKGWHWFTEVLNLQRSAFLGADAPPLFRQGLQFTSSHPVESVMKLIESFKAFKSVEGAHRMEQEIKNDPSYQDFIRAGGDLTSTEGPLSRRPEEFRSELIGKELKVGGTDVNLIGRLLRWNNAYMNKVRLRTFELLRRSMTSDGMGSEAELHQLATAVNDFTGRSKLPGGMENAVGFLSHIFMSPKFTFSRFMTLLGRPLWQGNMATRKAIGIEYARSAIGLGLVLGLAIAAKNAGADVDVTLDPRSADFGKIRTGNTRLDPYGGVQQAAVLLARLGSGQTTSQTGVVHNIRRTSLLNPMAPPLPAQFGQQTAYDTATSFARGRFTPALGTTVDVLSGQNMIGEPVPLHRGGIRLITPLTVSDVYEAYGDLGIPRGTATSIWAIFGGGTQSQNRLSRR